MNKSSYIIFMLVCLMFTGCKNVTTKKVSDEDYKMLNEVNRNNEQLIKKLHEEIANLKSLNKDLEGELIDNEKLTINDGIEKLIENKFTYKVAERYKYMKYGYVNFGTEFYDDPSKSSNSFIENTGTFVEVLTIVSDENNDLWALVQHLNLKRYEQPYVFYVGLNVIEEIDDEMKVIEYTNEYVRIGNVYLGEPFTDVIRDMNKDYYVLNERGTRYQFMGDDQKGLNIVINSLNGIVTSVGTDSSSFALEDNIYVGGNAIRAIEKLEQKYEHYTSIDFNEVESQLLFDVGDGVIIQLYIDTEELTNESIIDSIYLNTIGSVFSS